MPLKHQITNYHQKVIIKQITFVGFGVLVLWWQKMQFSELIK